MEIIAIVNLSMSIRLTAIARVDRDALVRVVRRSTFGALIMVCFATGNEMTVWTLKRRASRVRNNTSAGNGEGR
ncbi:MAG: hypothetical protein JO283_04740 [Bradyrhizobium sp.]|nr:hypothetical protein [Bradyrhizobium sp.]